MASSDYHILTHWRVRGTVQEVVDVLERPEDLPRWWPSVYLAVERAVPGDEHNVGAEFDLFTKGWLPYTLRWRLRIAAVEPYRRFVVEAAGGDFSGRGVWTFRAEDNEVLIEYDWNIGARKPMLRRWSFLLGPIFAWNHRWAMRRGGESLALELERRRARTPQERERIPAPPRSTFRF